MLYSGSSHKSIEYPSAREHEVIDKKTDNNKNGINLLIFITVNLSNFPYLIQVSARKFQFLTNMEAARATSFANAKLYVAFRLL